MPHGVSCGIAPVATGVADPALGFGPDVNDKFANIIDTTDLGQSTTPIVPEATLQSIHAGLVDLISAIETGAEPQSPPSEARKTVLLIEGILESHQRGNCRVNLSGGKPEAR